MSKVDLWLQKILWEHEFPEPNSRNVSWPSKDFEIHRLKGLVVLVTGATRMIQGVREVFDITEPRRRHGETPAPPERSKIVLIGKGVRDLPWQESLESFLAS